MAKTETWRPMHLKNDQPQLAGEIEGGGERGRWEGKGISPS